MDKIRFDIIQIKNYEGREPVSTDFDLSIILDYGGDKKQTIICPWGDPTLFFSSLRLLFDSRHLELCLDHEPFDDVNLRLYIKPETDVLHCEVFPPNPPLSEDITINEKNADEIIGILSRIIDMVEPFNDKELAMLTHDSRTRYMKQILSEKTLRPLTFSGVFNFEIYPYVIEISVEDYIVSIEELAEQYYSIFKHELEDGEYPKRYQDNTQHAKDWLKSFRGQK